MSFSSMRGRTIYIDDNIGSSLKFSDGTKQITAYTGEADGTLTVSGLTVNGDETVNGNETITGTLTVSGLTVNGDETITGTLTVSGLTVNGDETVNGNETITGTLTVQNDITADADVNILNNLTVYGNSVLGSSTSNSTTIYGKVGQNLPNSCTQYGLSALTNLTTGGSNVCVGVNSGYYTSTGFNNTAIGTHSMQSNTTGSSNVCIGFEAMDNSTTSSNNTVLGNSSGSSIFNGSYNTIIGSGSDCAYSYSSSIGYNSKPSANNQIMLGTSSETVQCPNVLNVTNALNVGSNYNASNTLNVLGGLNVNYVYTGVSANNNINGSTNTIVGSVQNTIESPTIYLTSDNTNIAGNCNIGTNSTSSLCKVSGNSIVGSSSSNTSTFNAIPSFVNGFNCGGNTHKLYMGTASWTGYFTDIYGTSGTQIPPNVNSGGTGYGSYALDQSISGISGCFINPQVNSTEDNGTVYPYIITWYFNQISDTQINVAFSNLGTNYETVPAFVYYIAFT